MKIPPTPPSKPISPMEMNDRNEIGRKVAAALMCELAALLKKAHLPESK